MEGNTDNSFDLISTAYENYHSQVLCYIRYRINDTDEAEDLAQDVFVRLIECGRMLREDTVKSFIFTIAHNIVTDYLRRFYKKQEICSYMMESLDVVVRSSETSLIANDIAKQEISRMSLLPPQRKQIYYMNRFMNMSADDISKRLCLSKRTVESHLFIGRKEIREYIKKCI